MTMSSFLMPGSGTLAMDSFFLVGWWFAILVLPPIMGWAWMVSNVFDKHAMRFFLGREKWNLVHMLMGVAAVAALVLMPLPGIAGFAAGYAGMLFLLAADIIIFVVVTNRDDERVPAGSKLRLDFSKMAEAKKAKAAAKHAATVALQIAGADKQTIRAPEKESPDYEIRIAAEQMFIAGSRLDAYQMDIAPGPDAYQISYLVDGVRQAGEKMLPQLAVKVIDFWKAAGGLDIEDRRRRLSGDASIRTDAETVPIRITSMGSKGGMRLTLTVNPAQSVRLKAEDLGLLDPQYESVRTLASEEEGLVLLAAPGHSGRSTTLYAMLKLHDAYTSNVQTVEMEPQDALEGIRQIEFDPYKEGAEYAVTVRSVLRRDPDVVGIAELPDEATAKEVAMADMERTRIYISLNAEDALTATQLYVKAVGDAKQASDVLRGVIAQRLARSLCENCRVPYAPPADMLAKLGLPADKVKQLFKKGGQVLIRNKPEICPVCQGIGYKGQTGLFEVFRIGPTEREMIVANNWSGLRAEFRKQQLPDIQQAALSKAVMGVTSIEEISRVCAPKKKSAPRKSKPGSSAQKPAAT